MLYAGVRQRCLALAIIVTAQFIIFDGLRTLLAVSKVTLALALTLNRTLPLPLPLALPLALALALALTPQR